MGAGRRSNKKVKSTNDQTGKVVLEQQTIPVKLASVPESKKSSDKSLKSFIKNLISN